MVWGVLCSPAVGLNMRTRREKSQVDIRGNGAQKLAVLPLTFNAQSRSKIVSESLPKPPETPRNTRSVH